MTHVTFVSVKGRFLFSLRFYFLGLQPTERGPARMFPLRPQTSHCDHASCSRSQHVTFSRLVSGPELLTVMLQVTLQHHLSKRSTPPLRNVKLKVSDQAAGFDESGVWKCWITSQVSFSGAWGKFYKYCSQILEFDWIVESSCSLENMMWSRWPLTSTHTLLTCIVRSGGGCLRRTWLWVGFFGNINTV